MQVKPVICIPGDNKPHDGLPCCIVHNKYIEAAVVGVGGIPWVLPSLCSIENHIEQVLDQVDGILLSGSLSNIEPHHYQGPASEPDTLHDPGRDALTLPLIPKAIARGVPLLGICRGYQELNVAMGGSLHQKVHELEGMHDHREDHRAPAEVRYGFAHELRIEPHGILERLVGLKVQQVNSLHGQGVDRLGEGLMVEARAADGLIEAVSVKDAKGFALAVQWHPEWQFQQHGLYQEILRAFGRACRRRALTRIGQ